MFYALISMVNEDLSYLIAGAIIGVPIFILSVIALIWLWIDSPPTIEDFGRGVLSVIKWIFIIICVIACPPIGIIYIINNDKK